MRRVSLALAVVTCAVASLTYLGAVAASAMWSFVFIGVVIASLAALTLGQPQQVLTPIAASIPVILWAVVVNSISGDSSGPAARSTAICGLATVFSIHGARRGRTDVFMAGLVWQISGAMLYGAAGEVLSPVVVTAVFAVCTILAITHSRHQLGISKSNVAGFVFAISSLLLLVFSFVMLSSLLPSLTENRSPVVSDALRQQTVDFEPAWISSNDVALPPQSSVFPPTRQAPTQIDVQIDQGTQTLDETLGTVIVLFLLLVVILGIFRMIWVQYRWNRWHRHLRSLPDREAIAGAWAAAFYSFRRWRWMTPDHFTTENAETFARQSAWPEPICADLGTLSDLASKALFSPIEPTSTDVGTSWQTSDDLISSIRRSTTLWKRFVGLLEGVG